MNRTANATSVPEAMGLRLERTKRLRVLDVVLVAVLVLSGATWVWVSVVGIEPALLEAIGSPAGRVIAAFVGLASVAAVIRAFLVSRWPVSDNDRRLV
jgi:hypothetical protein